MSGKSAVCYAVRLLVKRMPGKPKRGVSGKRTVVIAMSEKEDDRLEKTDPRASKPASTTLTMQAIIRVAEESSFVHFYLACGHLVTVKRSDGSNKQSKEMECWACSTEKGQT